MEVCTKNKIKREKFIVDLSRPVIVSMENFTYLVDSKCVSDDGKDWTIPLMNYDVISRNNSLYPKRDSLQSLEESTYVQENMRQRTWFAELEHPPKGSDIDRFMFVEPTRYAWNILKYWDTGDMLKGNVHLCAPLGHQIVLPNVKELGCNYAASCRFYTPNYIEKTEGGRKYLVKQYKMYPITFDCVSIPGIPKARLIDPDKYNPGDIQKTQESFYDVTFENPANTFKKMIMSGESNSILEDYFGVDMNTAHAYLLKNDRIELSNESSGRSVIVPLDRFLVNEVLTGIKKQKK